MKKVKSRKQRSRAAELSEVIDRMVRAMWSANKKYIARSDSPITVNMEHALWGFYDYCVRYYGKKA